jgi:hypothetical protein
LEVGIGSLVDFAVGLEDDFFVASGKPYWVVLGVLDPATGQPLQKFQRKILLCFLNFKKYFNKLLTNNLKYKNTFEMKTP